MSGANGSALLDDCLCGLLRRAGNELLIAECEPAGRGGRIWACVLRRSSSATKLFKRSVTASAYTRAWLVVGATVTRRRSAKYSGLLQNRVRPLPRDKRQRSV